MNNKMTGQEIGFLDSTFVWTENHYGGWGDYSMSLKYTVDSHPSLFAGKTYYEVLQTDEELSENWKKTGDFIRAENNIIYLWQNPQEIELYNFNLIINDTFPVYYFGTNLIVDSIDTFVLLTGEERKYLRLHCEYDDEPPFGFGYTEWVEGIGNINGFFYNNNQCVFDTDGSDIMCMFRNDTLIYDDPQINACWLLPTAIHEDKAREVLITPNPVSDFIHITGTPGEINFIRIFNTIGHQLYHGKSNTIDVNNFSSGYYTLVILMDNDHYEVKGFVKL
ncbi:MAG TPA: T9SS type A sorting domain-containing protein [Saprospiraceae bacterium]|nr:T9SS type A sorting domain-containing protein [Saprospiraceae bacterium]